MRFRKTIIFLVLAAVLLVTMPNGANASFSSDRFCPSSARDIPILKIEVVKSFATFIYNTLSIGLGPFAM